MAVFDIDVILDRMEFLDPLADSLQKLLGRGLAQGGPKAAAVKDMLNGTWLGHPLHPALTDVPIGAWTCSLLLDLADRGQGGELGSAADLLIGVGCASGLAAAASGLADWHDTYGRERRTGLAHALLNSAALGLFGGSLWLRLSGRRRLSRPLAKTGFLMALAGAFLGGDMVFRLGTQVNRNAWVSGPERWTAVADDSEVKDGELLRRRAGEAEVLLTRLGALVYAVGAVCPHAGGPLEEGTVSDAQVRCPWHGSRFDLRTGSVTHGPACVALPLFEARTTESGKVEVRSVPR